MSEESVEVLVNSIANSILKQYESSLKTWWDYIYFKGLNIYNVKTSNIIMFLNNRFQGSAKYSRLNTSRAAISLISVYDINNDGLILYYLENLHLLNKLKLVEVAQKVPTLLVLTTAHRLQIWHS